MIHQMILSTLNRKGLRGQKHKKVILGNVSTHTKHDFFKAYIFSVATFFQNSQNTKAMLPSLSKYIGK